MSDLWAEVGECCVVEPRHTDGLIMWSWDVGIRWRLPANITFPTCAFMKAAQAPADAGGASQTAEVWA